MSSIENVILDFDGTIADSFEAFIEALAEVLGREPISASQVESLRDAPSIQHIIKALGVKKWQIPKLLVRGRQIMSTKMPTVEIFDGMAKFLKDTSKTKKIYILSTNSESTIVDFLKRYKLEKTIVAIYSGTGLFGKSKRLKDLLKKENLELNQSVYIGDETRDVAAAQAIGMKSLAVSWGYNTAAALRACQPTALATEASKLKPIIERL